MKILIAITAFLLINANVFDVYSGKELDKDSKSLAISLTFQSNKKTLMREMALLKVVSSSSQLQRAKKLCKKYKYAVLDQTSRSFVFEVSALKKEIDDLIKKLQPLGLASASRTGVVAMTKGPEIYKQN